MLSIRTVFEVPLFEKKSLIENLSRKSRLSNEYCASFQVYSIAVLACVQISESSGLDWSLSEAKSARSMKTAGIYQDKTSDRIVVYTHYCEIYDAAQVDWSDPHRYDSSASTRSTATTPSFESGSCRASTSKWLAFQGR